MHPRSVAMRLVSKSPQCYRQQFTAKYLVAGELKTRTFVYIFEDGNIRVSPQDIVRRIATFEDEFKLKSIEHEMAAVQSWLWASE